jgi:hypothetical protein
VNRGLSRGAGRAHSCGPSQPGRLSDVGEAVLRRWTRQWTDVALRVGADWEGEPYDSGDFENALCIFQEPPHADFPDPGAFASHPAARHRRKAGC